MSAHLGMTDWVRFADGRESPARWSAQLIYVPSSVTVSPGERLTAARPGGEPEEREVLNVRVMPGARIAAIHSRKVVP